MNFIYKFSVALLAACLLASSASAVTVTFTQTGTVSGIDDYHSNPGGSLQSFTALQGGTISIGDTFSHSFTLDLNAISAPNSCSGANCPPFGQYLTSNGQITFSSGFVSALAPHSLVVRGQPEYDLFGATTGYLYSFEYQFLGGTSSLNSCSSPVQVYGGSNQTRVPTSFSATPAEVLSNFGSAKIDYMTARLDQSFLTGTQGGCNEAIFLSFSNINSSFAYDNTQIVDPNVTPVPVPAPFAMLGLAFAGLIGFKRTRKA